MKHYKLLSFEAIAAVKKTVVFSIIVSSVIFASCEKTEDVNSNPEPEISPNSIYFSFTLNDEFFEFKSPDAKLYSTSKATRSLRILDNNTLDSCMIEYRSIFVDQKYKIEFRFNNAFLVDTLELKTTNAKSDMFRKGAYPFQFLEFADYGMRAANEEKVRRPKLPHVGINISIYDIKNHKHYTSNVDFMYRDSIHEYENHRENSLFQITNSFRTDSIAGILDPFNSDLAEKWYLEANFKCKLYELGKRHDPNYLENAVYISDGVLKGSF